MLVAANFDSRWVQGQEFVERAAFAHQHAVALRQGVIQGFDDARAALGHEHCEPAGNV